jgi:dipeptidyl-peptidase 4
MRESVVSFSRAWLAFLLLAGTAFAQKKAITLNSLQAWRNSAAHATPGDPVWAPDGKTFAYRQGNELKYFDIAAKKSYDVVDLTALDNAALSPPTPERYEWENRRVDEATLQWSPRGRAVLYDGGGDLFLITIPGGEWRQLVKTPAAEHDPKFSPDGTRVAFRRNWDLYVLNLTDGRETRLTSDGSDTLRNAGLDWVYPEELELGTAFWWAPDSSAIAYLQFNVSGEPLYPHADLLGSRAVLEPQRYPQAGEKNATVRVGVIPAAGGGTKWLDVGDTINTYLIARAGWVPDSTRVYIARTNRIQNQLDFLVFDVASGKSRTVYRESDSFWVNIAGEPVFLKDGKRFLWTSERDGFRHLYLYSLDGAEPQQLTRGLWEETDIAGLDEKAGRVYFRSTEASPVERQLYSVRLDGGEKRPITAGAGTHRISMAPDASSFLDIYSNLSSPPEGTLRSANGDAIALYRPADRRAFAELDVRPTEIVEFKGKDGTSFYGRLIKPPGFDPAKKYPLLVDVYGGPHVQAVRNAWPGLGMDQVFAQAGYVVWEMDNRGSAGRGHAFETPVYRNLGARELADQREGVEYLISRGFIDPQRVGVTGWSYGGFMTLNLLFNAPDLFHAGFAGAPVTSWLNYDTIYTERYMGLPDDNAEAYARTSLARRARNLTGKLMIAHNLEDDNVLFQNSAQVIRALEVAGKHFELSLYTEKTHGLSGAEARQMDATMVDFFERNLKPPPSPAPAR